MNPTHKSVTVKLVYDWYQDLVDRNEDDGEWYKRSTEDDPRPDGGFYKVTRPGRYWNSREDYQVWLKPGDGFTDPTAPVAMARAFYREDWCFVGVIVEATAALVAENGRVYTDEETDSLWGIEYGTARRLKRGEPTEDDPTGWHVMTQKSCEDYIREVALDLRRECERQSGVPIPDDAWEAALAKALDAGPSGQ